MNYRLPFLNIIVAAIYFAWTNKAEFLRAIAVPTLVLVVVWGVWSYFSEDVSSGYLSLVYALAYSLSFSFLAVTCHRLILVDEIGRNKPFNAKPGYRELKFLGWVIVISIITVLLEFPTTFIALNIPGGMAVTEGGKLAAWAKEIVSVPALYVFARLSLAFPATAIDKKSGLRWSWVRTRGNGWRIFIVVALFPWLGEMAFGFLWREEATVLEQALLTILAIVGLSIEIVALSFTYKELARQYAAEQQPESGEMEPMPTSAFRDSFHDLAPDGKSRKLFVALMVAMGLAVAYLFAGSLFMYFADCNSELVRSATSPGGTHKAELFNKTCKDNKHDGLFLEVAKTTTPRTYYSYRLTSKVPDQFDLVWPSEQSLFVRYAGTLDLTHVPTTYDDVQIVFEKIEPTGSATHQ